MDTSQQMKPLLLVLPVLLLLSTALVFVLAGRWLGQEKGYLIGFLFYWLAWCVFTPLWMLKKEGVYSLFKEEWPLFIKTNWAPAVLWILIASITIVMYPPAGLSRAPLALVLIAIPVATINGICEELLWRGLYIKAFPGNIVMSVLFPSVGFAIWHISPQLVYPAEGGIWQFTLSTLFLGLGYGWIAYRTGSIKWTVIAHSFGGILSLGGAIAPTLMSLI